MPLHHRWQCYQSVALNDPQVGPTSLSPIFTIVKLFHTVMQTVRQNQKDGRRTKMKKNQKFKNRQTYF